MSDADVDRIVASLQESEDRRAAIKARFGFVPSSVLREIHRGELSRRIFHYGREQGINKTIGERAEKKGGVYLHPRLRGQGDRSTRERNPEHFSIMPPELVDFFVRFYAAPGQTYLDPFAGQGVRMQVAKIRGLDYRATDISIEFTSFIDAVKAKIDDRKTVIQVERADARKPDAIPDGCGDFLFTSPPYWDIEDYGDEPEQLGIGKSYADFMRGMADVARAWLPKFKPGAFACWNVNDFRKDGKFYPYHSDLSTAMIDAGWEPFDVWIVEGLVGGISKVYAGERISRKYAPKAHEYVLIFRAPGVAPPPKKSKAKPGTEAKVIEAIRAGAKTNGVALRSTEKVAAPPYTFSMPNEVVEKVRAVLGPEFLHPKRRAEFAGHPSRFAGLCYVASEALFHAFGKASGFVPMKIDKHEGTDHWFLQDPSGVVIDATAEQFRTPIPYETAKRRSFMTAAPSKRAVEVLSRAGIVLPRAKEPTTPGRELAAVFDSDPSAPPVFVEHEGVLVARDDFYPGGTKARFAARLFDDVEEVVYASPAEGGAQIALAAVARRLGKRATLFVAARANLHPATFVAAELGAKIVLVPMGYLSNCQAKARAYVATTPGARLAPFGFAVPEGPSVIAAEAVRGLLAAGVDPASFTEVWAAASSGTLAKGLRLAFPHPTQLHLVQVGHEVDDEAFHISALYVYDRPYGKPGRVRPPFSANPNYEWKAWELCRDRHGPGPVLFWNVVADAPDLLT